MKSKRIIYFAFILGLLVKAFDALIEIGIGIYLLFNSTIINSLIFKTNQELVEDPTDFFTRYINKALVHVNSDATLFATIYLIAHGIIKVWLVWAMLTKKLWAYPIAIAVLLVFVVVQLERLIVAHSILFGFLAMFDLIVVWLIWREYQTLNVTGEL